jgi:LPXTG-site transpeptidase (sortase) family protein
MLARPSRDDPQRALARRALRAGLSLAAKLSFGLGALCAGLFVLAQTDRTVASASALDAFREVQASALALTPDQTAWSAKRQADYRESLAEKFDAPTGVLEIPSLKLTVPIFSGTTELVLNRGIGWIEGTAMPGEEGNVGLAGHRDGYFRGLKDLKLGDTIDVQSVGRTLHYRVTDLKIVDPTDVSVLDPTDEPSVTLVTCYPFYYVGNAPQRYIVRGTLDRSRT